MKIDLMRHKPLRKNRNLTQRHRGTGRSGIESKGASRSRRLFFEPLEERSLLAVITVTRLDDAVGTGDGVTLREAIVAANTNAKVDGSTAGQAAPVMDTIVFAPGLAGTISLGAGGQLLISETVKIQGNGAASTIIDAHGASRVFEVLASGGNVTFDGVTITGGSDDFDGGAGIYFDSNGLLTVQNSTIFGNSISTQTTTRGGGIFASGAVTVIGSTIRDNSVFADGDFSTAEGGGIFASGEVTVTSSTISGNTVTTIQDNNSANGGGIGSRSAVRITQSTISGNSVAAPIGSFGGGIEAPAIFLMHSTVTGNSASGSNGKGGGLFGSNMTIRNSIVAGNTDTTGNGPDFSSFFGDPFVFQASLIGDNNGTGLTASATPDANGNLIGTHAAPIDPLLGPLAFNGGPTQTHALLPGSPALDLGKIDHSKVILATPNVRALYRFEEDDGATAAANSTATAGLNGAYINGVTLGTANELETGESGNTLGKVATFDGVNDQVALLPAIVPAGGFTDFSLSFWVNFTQPAAAGSQWFQGQGLVDGTAAGAGSDFGTSILDNKFAFGVGAPETTVSSSQAINDGQWHHVVATRVSASGAMAVYVDGVLGGTATGPTGPRTSTTRLVIGSLQTTRNFFTGQMDEVAIFTRALDAVEVASLYQAEVPPASDQRQAPFARAAGSPAKRDAGAYERQTVANLSLVVDTAVDENDGNYAAGDLSLREAIGLANGSLGADTITFAPAINGQPILLSQGQLEIGETVTIQGNGAGKTIIDAHGASRVFEILASGGDVTFDGVTITGGLIDGNGGGIRSLSSGVLTVQNSTISGNTATGVSNNAEGGGIYVVGAVMVTSSTISGNSAVGGFGAFGGGLLAEGAVTVIGSTINENSVMSGTGSNAGGGGIFTSFAAVTVTSSTISGNSATGDVNGTGGGIRSIGTVMVTSSTISGNSVSASAAISLANGGGIAGTTIFVLQSTVTGNSSTGTGAGGGLFSSTALTIRNSIVAGNTDSDSSHPDLRVFGPLVVQASLIGDNNGTGLTPSATPDAVNGNIIGGAGAAKIDPKLGPLANNGGPTQTHAPLVGSPALNLGKIDHSKAILATPGVRALYRFEEAVGATVAANSTAIAGLNGTYTNGADLGLGDTNNLQTGDGGNTLGKYATFDGQDDQVVLPAAVIPAGGFTDFSLSFWVYLTQGGGGTGSNWYEGKGLVDGAAAAEPFVDFGTSILGDKFAFGVGSPDTTVTSAQTLNDDRWHHVVATRASDSGAMAVYVDGVLGGTAAGPTGARTSATRLVIGSLQTNGNFFGGRMDEVAVFTRALDASEVASLFQAEVPPDFDQRGLPFSRVLNGARDAGAHEFFVNTAPTCTVGPAQNTDDEKGLQTVAGWVINCSANDPLQTASFSISTDKPELFTAVPELDASGQLKFDPAPNVHGTAIVTVTIQDNGGTASGGTDRTQVAVQINVKKPHRLFNAAETGERRGLDVTGSTSLPPDGFIVSGDVLAVINYINAKGSGEIPLNGPFGPAYVDVNGDNQVVADDVIKIINWINANPGQSEGEEGSSAERGVRSAEYETSDSDVEGLILLLAADVARLGRKGRRA